MAISDIYSGGKAGDWWTPDTAHAFTDAGTTPVASNGDLIYQINGQQGSVNLVQATSGARPVYRPSYTAGGYPAYELQSGDYWSNLTIDFGSPGKSTFFMLLNYTALGAYHNIYDTSVIDPMLWIDSANKLEANGDGGTGNPTITSASAWSGALRRIIMRQQNSASAMFVDGSNVGSNSSGTHTTGSRTVSIHNRGGSNTLRASVVVFGYVIDYLDDTAVAALDTALAAYLSAPSGGKGMHHYYQMGNTGAF